MKANRKSVRAPVVPTPIRGILTRSVAGDQCPFLIWDVSESGMGLWCTSKLEKGEAIKLTVGQPFPLLVNCRVMWIHEASEGDSDGYRCGVEVVDEPSRIATLYNKFRDLMESQASSR